MNSIVTNHDQISSAKITKIRRLQELEKNHVTGGVCNCYCDKKAGSNLISWGMTRNAQQCGDLCAADREAQGMHHCANEHNPFAIISYLITPVNDKRLICEYTTYRKLI